MKFVLEQVIVRIKNTCIKKYIIKNLPITD